MKFHLVALLLMAAGACAMPPASDVVVVDSPNPPAPKFVVENQIRRAIQQISKGIKDAGLDPLEIEKEEFEIIPIPFFVEVKAFIENLRFAGASNIRIHNLDYSLLFNRLRFDISLPQLSLTVGDSGIEGSVFNNKVEGQLKGSLIIQSIRLSGEVRLYIGIISGINLRSISLNFRVGSIKSNFTLSAQGNDYSDFVNTLFNESIPDALEDNRADINKLLEDIIRAVLDSIL